MGLRSRVWIMSPIFLLPLLVFAAGKGDEAKGKTLFGRCSICHGASGEGKEAIAKAYGVKIRALSSKEVQSLDNAALKKIIVEGKGKMQPVKLSDAEVADILAFIRTLKKPSPK
jgi:mono/diheme cytochrome c family protein